jgi:hypothetical protein
MPKPIAFAARQSFAFPTWRRPAFLAVYSLVALATLAGGIAAIFVHTRASAGEHVLAPAGLVLLVSSVVQSRSVWRLWRPRRMSAPNLPLATWRSWRQLLAGAFVAYIAAAAIGPARYLSCAWLAAVAAWYTLLFLPLAASPTVLELWRKWSQERARRRLSWLVYVSMLLVIIIEAGLRTHHVARQHGWLARAAGLPAPTDDVNLLGPFSDGPHIAAARVAHLTAGPFRVAVLADKESVRGARHNGYLARVGQILPGLEIVPIALPRPWSSASSNDLTAQLSAARPDLVLAVLSLCNDLTHQAPTASWFDWRQFEIARLVIGTHEGPAHELDVSPVSTAGGDEFESFLRGLAPQLAVCRTPIDESMRSRWQQAFSSLDQLVCHCRDQELAVALVLVPGEFQVNRVLCATLVRRSGCTADQLDVELPQRKLAGFAEQHGVPLIDLLPSLRLCPQSPYERNTAVWNEHGNTAAAAAIGGWLESRYGGQLAVAAQLSSAP